MYSTCHKLRLKFNASQPKELLLERAGEHEVTIADDEDRNVMETWIFHILVLLKNLFRK